MPHSCREDYALLLISGPGLNAKQLYCFGSIDVHVKKQVHHTSTKNTSCCTQGAAEELALPHSPFSDT